MDSLSQRSELLVELRDAGQVFLEDSRSSDTGLDPKFNNYRICHMVPEESERNIGHTIITALIDVPTTIERASAMNQPVFEWNGSIKDPIVAKAGNKLVNVSECFPPSLTLLALDYVQKGYGQGDTIYDQFVKKVGALFFAEASPKDF